MDRDHKHHNQNSGFSNGFLLGALIGGGMVFLLGTKKGKEVLKTLTENGFEGVAELRELLSDEDDSFIEEYAQEGKSPVSKTEEVKTPAKSLKRFFRGVKR